ncbi:MAG: CHAT domain-containing tetratricopeptide repeat protein [Bacteroidota bacterium]
MKKSYSCILFINLFFYLSAQQQIDFDKQVAKIDNLEELGSFAKADSLLVKLETSLANTSLIKEDSVQLYIASKKALFQYKLGNCSNTIKYSKRELYLKEKLYEASSPLVFSSMRNLGVYYLNCDSTEKSIEVLEDLVKKHKVLIGTVDVIYARTLDDLAFAYARNDEDEKAASTYEELLTLLEESKGSFYYTVLDSYTSFLINLERYEEAAENYEELESYNLGKSGYLKLLEDFHNLFLLLKNYVRSLETSSKITNFCAIDEAECASMNVDIAKYVLINARLSMVLASYPKALENYDQAAKRYADDPTIYNRILVEQAELYNILGDYENQLEVLNLSVESHKSNSLTDSATYSSAVFQLGNLYTKIGRLGEAERLYESYIDELKDTNAPARRLAKAYQSLGNQRYLKQNFNDADQYFALGKELLQKEGLENSLEYASILNSYGALQEAISNFGKAENAYTQALAIVAEQEVPLRIPLASNLANILLKVDIENDSIPALMDKSLEWQLAATGSLHPNYANIVSSKALYLQQIESFDAASKAYSEAISIFEQTVGEEYSQYLAALTNQALMLELQAKFDEALATMNKARGLYEKHYQPSNPGYIQLLNNLANFYAYQGQTREAEDLFIKLTDIQVRQINESFTYLSEAEKKVFVKDKQKLLNNFKNYIVSTSLQSPTDISGEILRKWYELELNTKGILLNATQQVRSRIFKGDNEELKELFSEWALARKQLAEMQSLKSESVSDQQALTLLIEKTDQLEKQLSRESTSFSGAFVQEKPSFKAIQSTLKESEAAVEVIRTEINNEAVYTALIATNDQDVPELIVLGKGVEFEQKSFNLYKNGIAFKIADTKSFETYWRKIDEYLKSKNATKIFFAPDGVYHKISLNTLYNPDSKDYLIDELEIVQVTSTKDIIGKGEGPVPMMAFNDILLVGSPTYNLEGAAPVQKFGQSRAVNMISSVAELPGTEEEVNSILGLLDQETTSSRVLLKKEASEEKVKENLNKDLVHIATHGFFSEESKGDYNDPMLSSGLLFAGVSNELENTDDGILTAYEIMNLGLDKTDMVILSACETGRGEISSGEGIYGLQRAFFVNGVRTVVMSLWKVDDTATKDLMISFYNEYLKKGDRREAFLKAQKKVKKKYKSPIYWGAFVMLGS